MSASKRSQRENSVSLTEAAALGAGLSIAGRGALDLREGARREAAAFADNKANELDLAEAQRRFRVLAQAHKEHGTTLTPDNLDMKHIAFPKAKLDEADLLNLGFEPTLTAIPEHGQHRITSFRHPASNFHIHDHHNNWVMHEDAHSALDMRMRLNKLVAGGQTVLTPGGEEYVERVKSKPARDFIGGVKHVADEGIPAITSYLREAFSPNTRSMADRAQEELSLAGRAALDSIEDKKPSSLHRDLLDARTLGNKGRLGLGIGAGVLGLFGLNKLQQRRDAMKKKASITYRGHTFSGYNKPKRNTGPGKHKKMVLAKQGDKIRLIRFGHKDYGHNISPKRKANYLKRSAGIRDKSGRLTKDNKLSANYWSRKTLWPASKPTLAEKRANLDLLKKYRHDIGGALGGGLLGGGLGYGSGYTDKDGKSNRLKRSLIGATAGGLTGLGFGRMSRRLGDAQDQIQTMRSAQAKEVRTHADRVRQLQHDNDARLAQLQEKLKAQHGEELSNQTSELSKLQDKFDKQSETMSQLQRDLDARNIELSEANTNLSKLKQDLQNQEARPAQVTNRSRPQMGTDTLESLNFRGERLGLARREGESPQKYEKRIEAAEGERHQLFMRQQEEREELAERVRQMRETIGALRPPPDVER